MFLTFAVEAADISAYTFGNLLGRMHYGAISAPKEDLGRGYWGIWHCDGAALGTRVRAAGLCGVGKDCLQV